MFTYLYRDKLGIPVEVPEDLEDLVKQTASIVRGKSNRYPPDLITDNDLAHLHRLVRWAESLYIEEDDKEMLVRMLWLHDLPEIETLDIPAVDKGIDHNADLEIEVNENMVAQRMFDAEDYVLYSQFNKAKAVLENKDGDPECVILPIAYIARVLDIVDGNLGTYHFLSKWSVSPAYDPNYYFPDDISNYMERQYTLYTNELKQVPIDAFYKSICLRAFKDQFAASLAMWSHVPHERIPAKHWESLQWAKEQVLAS